MKIKMGRTAIWAILVNLPLSITSFASDEPDWIHLPARTVDSGFIVYVSVAEDSDLDRAIFKSEVAGILDVANECSFAPKGTRTEDQYQIHPAPDLYRVYTKTGIEFTDCDTAKNAVDPNQIRSLSNPQFSREIQEYEILIGAEEPDSQEQWDEPFNYANVEVTPIVSDSDYILNRQKIYYIKETIILAPPNTYLPGTAETIRLTNALKPLQVQIHNYEARNPQIRNWRNSWTYHPLEKPRQNNYSNQRPVTVRAQMISRPPSKPFRIRKHEMKNRPKFSVPKEHYFKKNKHLKR